MLERAVRGWPSSSSSGVSLSLGCWSAQEREEEEVIWQQFSDNFSGRVLIVSSKLDGLVVLDRTVHTTRRAKQLLK